MSFEFCTAERKPLDAWLDELFRQEGRPKQNRREFEWLLHKVGLLHPRRVLEVGNLYGAALFLFGQVSALDATLYGVDIKQRADAVFGKYGKRAGQQVLLFEGDSCDVPTIERVKAWLGPEPLDFVFIDGDHRYDSVRRDYGAYAPLVRSGGIVALHDVHSVIRPRHCEVSLFWKELTDDVALNTQSLVNWDQRPDPFGIGIVRVA